MINRRFLPAFAQQSEVSCVSRGVCSLQDGGRMGGVPAERQFVVLGSQEAVNRNRLAHTLKSVNLT
jgi:hypothetical protein